MRSVFAALVLSATAASAAEHVVSAHGAAFDPKELTVRAGDTVTWKNDDIVAHTVKANDGSFSSKELTPDAKFQWKARKKGKHEYVCTLHPGMRGTIIVR